MTAAKRCRPQCSFSADNAYDTAEHVARLRRLGVTPHVAQNNTGWTSAIDARTTRHPGYVISQRLCKGIDERFGWINAAAEGYAKSVIGASSAWPKW